MAIRSISRSVFASINKTISPALTLSGESFHSLLWLTSADIYAPSVTACRRLYWRREFKSESWAIMAPCWADFGQEGGGSASEPRDLSRPRRQRGVTGHSKGFRPEWTWRLASRWSKIGQIKRRQENVWPIARAAPSYDQSAERVGWISITSRCCKVLERWLLDPRPGTTPLIRNLHPKKLYFTVYNIFCTIVNDRDASLVFEVGERGKKWVGRKPVGHLQMDSSCHHTRE